MRGEEDRGATGSDVLDLTPFNIIASGMQRNVYLMPSDYSTNKKSGPVVLKVPRTAARLSRRNGVKRLIYRLFPSTANRVIVKEAKYAERLHARLSATVHPLPVPEFLGYVQTSGGLGAYWQAICAEDGTLAPTLKALAIQGDLDRMLDPLNRFVSLCFAHHIVAPEINWRNLVATDEDGALTIYLVDGFADHRVISLRSMFSWINQKSLINRFEKVARQLELHFDPVARRFSHSNG